MFGDLNFQNFKIHPKTQRNEPQINAISGKQSLFSGKEAIPDQRVEELNLYLEACEISQRTQVQNDGDTILLPELDQAPYTNSRQVFGEASRKIIKTSTKSHHTTQTWENDDIFSQGSRSSTSDTGSESMKQMSKIADDIALTPEFSHNITAQGSELLLEVIASGLHPCINSLKPKESKNYLKWLGDHFFIFVSEKQRQANCPIQLRRDCLSSIEIWNTLFDQETRIGMNRRNSEDLVASLERIKSSITYQNWIDYALEFFSQCTPEKWRGKRDALDELRSRLYEMITKVVKEAATQLMNYCEGVKINHFRLKKINKKKVIFCFRTDSSFVNEMLCPDLGKATQKSTKRQSKKTSVKQIQPIMFEPQHSLENSNSTQQSRIIGRESTRKFIAGEDLNLHKALREIIQVHSGLFDSFQCLASQKDNTTQIPPEKISFRIGPLSHENFENFQPENLEKEPSYVDSQHEMVRRDDYPGMIDEVFPQKFEAYVEEGVPELFRNYNNTHLSITD